MGGKGAAAAEYAGVKNSVNLAWSEPDARKYMRAKERCEKVHYLERRVAGMKATVHSIFHRFGAYMDTPEKAQLNMQRILSSIRTNFLKIDKQTKRLFLSKWYNPSAF